MSSFPPSLSSWESTTVRRDLVIWAWWLRWQPWLPRTAMLGRLQCSVCSPDTGPVSLECPETRCRPGSHVTWATGAWRWTLTPMTRLVLTHSLVKSGKPGPPSTNWLWLKWRHAFYFCYYVMAIFLLWCSSDALAHGGVFIQGMSRVRGSGCTHLGFISWTCLYFLVFTSLIALNREGIVAIHGQTRMFTHKRCVGLVCTMENTCISFFILLLYWVLSPHHPNHAHHKYRNM